MTVVIVTYESAHCLDALDTLLSHCPHVIIVDNGSTDGTVTAAKNRWPHATVIALPSNHGFGAANNRALAHVQTPWVLLLNPDCLIAPETLARMIYTGETMPDTAILAPQLLNIQERPEVNYRWPTTEWKSKGPGADGPCCVGFACGAAMLMRVKYIPYPAFDENFFLYYEDDDICLRLFKQKHPIVILPECVAIHRSRGSVQGHKRSKHEYFRGYHHAQSKLTFIEKHQSIMSAQRTRITLLATTTATILLRLIIPSPRLTPRIIGRWIGLLRWKPKSVE